MKRSELKQLIKEIIREDIYLGTWNQELIFDLLNTMEQNAFKFFSPNKMSGVSQGKYGKVSFRSSERILSLIFDSSVNAKTAFNDLSTRRYTPYSFSNKFDENPKVISVTIRPDA